MNSHLPLVLIVEDEPMVRDQLFFYLEDFEEFRLASAGTGEDALRLLVKEPADLCVVDLRMPGMNGVDFIRAAKARALCRHFVVHTGVVDRTLELEMSALGLSEHDILLKPVDLEKLLAKARAVAPSVQGSAGEGLV